MERRIHALTARVTYLESSLAENDRHTGKLASELAKLAPAGDKLGVLEGDLASVRKELGDMTQRLEDMEAAQQDEAVLEGLKAQIDALGERLERLEPQLSTLAEEVRIRTEQVTRLETTVDQLLESDRKREQDAQDSTEWIELANEQDERLTQALEATGERLRSLEEAQGSTGSDLGSIKEENRVRGEQITRLLAAVDRLRESDRKREQDAQDSSGWIERANEQDERLTQALEATGERLQGLEEALGSTGSDLDSVKKENRVRGEQVTRLVAAVDRLREADRQREQDAQDSSGWIERASARDERLETGLKAAEERLELLETTLEETGGTLDALRGENSVREEKTSGLESAIEELRGSDTQRLQQLEEIAEQFQLKSERDQQLEKGLGASEERLDQMEALWDETRTSIESLQHENRLREEQVGSLDSAIGQLKESDSQLGQQLQDITGRADRAEERLQDLDTALNAVGTRVDTADKENGVRDDRIAGLESTAEESKASASRLEQRLRDASERIERGEERHEELSQSFGASSEQLQQLKKSHDSTGVVVDSIREQNGGRDQKLAGLKSRLQTLTWSGAAALVALTVGLLTYVGKHQTDRGIMEYKLNQVERRLSQVVDAGAPQTGVPARDGEGSGQVQRLSQEIEGLNTALGGLSDRIGDFRQAEGQALNTRMDSYAQEQAGVVANLDDLGARLAQIENRLGLAQQTSLPADEPLIPPADVSQAPEQLWKKAREQRRFTLQLLGVHKRSSLVEYAQRHNISTDSVALETEHDGKPWFVLFHGIYESRSQAAEAARDLAATLPPETQPWVRRIPREGAVEVLE